MRPSRRPDQVRGLHRDFRNMTKPIQRLVVRQEICWQTSTAIPVVSGTFRHYAHTHTHAEARNATSLSCRNINSNSECCFDFMCRNVWAQAIRWQKIGDPCEEIFWLPLPGCHWLTQHALFCRRWYWKTEGLPHSQLESWASCFNAETHIYKQIYCNWIRIYVLLNLVTKCAWFSTNLAWFQHVLFSVARTCNLKPGQGQRQVAWWQEGKKP